LIPLSIVKPPDSKTTLVVYRHNVHFIKGARAARTFAHAVANAVVHTLAAKEMTASLERRVLKVISADAAKGKRSQHLFFFR